MREDFAVFIISHERADRVESYELFRKSGYSGKIYIVIDNQDSQIEKYMDRFENVYVFDKQAYMYKTYVTMRISACATYARNAVEDIAKELNLSAFIMADDDLIKLRYRYDNNGVLKSQSVINLDAVLEEYVNYMLTSSIACLSFGTANSYMGKLKPEVISNNRLPFNCFIRNVSREWDWKADIYEDAVTSIVQSWYGDFAMQLPFIQCDMAPMNAGANGGMTGTYNTITQYEKQFPVLIYCPSCVKLGFGARTFIYSVIKKNAFPKLVSSKYKKSPANTD